MGKWKISKSQKKLLDNLFEGVEIKKVKKVLDMGAGRTSVHYLANKFKSSNIEAVVYPGDTRKIKPILECVPERNYEIIESDIKNFKNKEYDLILAHMFLGEADKFGNNKFKKILEFLFAIKTKYLVIVNISYDNIDYFSLLKKAKENGEIINMTSILTESGSTCLGLTIKKYK